MFCHSIEMFNFEKTKKMVFQKKKCFKEKRKDQKINSKRLKFEFYNIKCTLIKVLDFIYMESLH